MLIPTARGQSGEDPARTLAARIAEQLGERGPVKVECSNQSAARSTEFESACGAFISQLQRLGFSNLTAGTVVRFVATERVGGSLLVGEADIQDRRLAAAEEWQPVPSSSGLNLHVSRSVLVTTSVAALDAFVQGTDVYVLCTDGVIRFSRIDDGAEYKKVATLPLRGLRTMPRDPRGRLVAANGALTAYLPGSLCTHRDIQQSIAHAPGSVANADAADGNAPAVPDEFTCSASTASWMDPILPGRQAASWVDGRNYLQDGSSFFYTAAVVPEGTVVAGLDGVMRLMGRDYRQLATGSDFGSDVISVQSECGRVAFATLKSTRDDADAIVPVNVVGSTLRPGAAMVTVPGPVTALWPSVNANEFTEVNLNLSSGVYELSRVAVTCSR